MATTTLAPEGKSYERSWVLDWLTTVDHKKIGILYIANSFMFFFFAGLSLIVLRVREPDVERPFRVPLYPITPLLFCAACLYMLQSSLAYTGTGALAGVIVLLAGFPVLFAARQRQQHVGPRVKYMPESAIDH